ncbi:hypothetical protein BWQ96_06236 [Gracilariopsis chorda]|uniref:Uncharacterized protein n=1 Tax=Gracilariopsis chorda TaxID=448386 RepID=A0A2V3IPL8_9FLOR|nr:hypothetical protein BWQ96_06236 [Gracilariopsis chorda]|eukprot:PXF44003.1 hypothetical protein BWQ96_06236 [Gracilariopsis chorda]
MYKILSKRKGSAEDAENQPTPRSENPGLPLFSVKSTDPEDRMLNIFRRMFSSNASVQSGLQSPSFNRMCSLVPPNYKPLFPVVSPEMLKPETYEPTHHLFVLSLSDNAIRNEIRDMYHILKNMDMRPLMLTTEDISLFLDWFAVFHSVISEVFYMEEAVLYSWIEGADDMTKEERKWETKPNPITGHLSEGRRKKRHGEILGLGTKILRSRSYFEGRPVMQELPELAKNIQNFVSEIYRYMELKRTELPAFISKRFCAKQARILEKKLWETVRNLEHPAYVVSAMTSSMSRREVRRIKNRYFSATTRRLINRWQTTYEQNHKEILGVFNDRLLDSQKEREHQVQENEFARAHAQPLEPVDQNRIQNMVMCDSDSRAPSCASTFHDNSMSASHSVHMVSAV